MIITKLISALQPVPLQPLRLRARIGSSKWNRKTKAAMSLSFLVYLFVKPNVKLYL